MSVEVEEARKRFVEGRLRSDFLACDLQWSLLVAALSSYRHDTVLRPFPPMFVGDSTESKDYAKLEQTCRQIPELKSVSEPGGWSTLESQAVELLHWSLATNFRLVTCDKSVFSDIQKLTNHSEKVPVPVPNYIFEFIHSSESDDKFQEKRQGRDLLYAYHGSRLENFHSILHYGLQSHMNKNALYGEGTYLSSELSVSIPYSPTGKSWSNSALGEKLSAVAVCQIIDDPMSVKCQTKDAKGTSNGSSSRSRARAPESMAGDVPEKYYVVRNNEVVRVKFIFIYATPTVQRSLNHRWQWVSRYKFGLLMLLYAILLLAVGLYRSKSVRYYLRRYLT